MNRKILFRGKRVDNGEWVYGFLVCANYIDELTQKVCYDGQEEIRYCTVEHYQVDTNTVGQFTGLCDKNGTKIFEGDIIMVKRLDDGKEAIFSIHIGEYTEANTSDKNIGVYALLDDGITIGVNDIIECHDLFCVIGNIHDNPELLEVEQ